MRSMLCGLVLVAGLGPVTSISASPQTYVSDQTLPTGSTDIPQFGFSVALRGDEALVAAPKQSGAMFGSIVLYRKSSSGWAEETTFAYPQSAFDFHAYVGFNGMAIDGDTVAIGISNANSSTGSVQIFERRDTVGWVLSQTLSAPTPSTFEYFGAAVALSGSSLIVGAPGHEGIGAAYVFDHDRFGWNLQSTLSASDGATGDAAGFSVAIDGDLAVLGAPHAHTDKGAGYVFRRSGTTWSEIRELSSGDSDPSGQFGAAVALSGDTAIVGSPEWNSGDGAVYVYDGPSFSDNVARLSKVVHNFGSAVGISGNRMIVGAVGSNAAYAYTRGGTNWYQRATFSDISTSRLGGAVAISGTDAIIGAFGDDRAYIVHDDQIFADGYE